MQLKMNKSLNIFLVILLCVVLYVGLLFSFYSSKNFGDSNPHLGYAIPTGGGCGTYAVSADVSRPTGLDVAVPMSSRRSLSMSSPRMLGYGGYYTSQNVQYLGGTYNSQSPIAYMSSSQTMKSFGGGGNSGSVSVSGGSVQSSASSVAPAGLSVSMPSTSAYAYNTNRNTRSNTGDLSTLTSGEFATASSYAGIGQTTAGGPMGIRGRRNANGLDDNFIDWLDGLIGDGSPNEWYAYKMGDVFYFNYDNLYDLYIQAVENGQLPEGVSWEMFLQWFKGQSDTYAFPIPSGVWFMTVLALGYALMIYFKKRKLQKQL